MSAVGTHANAFLPSTPGLPAPADKARTASPLRIAFHPAGAGMERPRRVTLPQALSSPASVARGSRPACGRGAP